MAEYVDVVDENDRPTGRTVSKREAETTSILHRCVAVFVFDRRGRLYMQPHADSGGLLDHSVGGHVSAGEDYAVAAQRESEEELGLKGQTFSEIALGVISPEKDFNGVGAYGVRPYHMYGVYECHPDASWQFAPTEEVARIVPERIEVIVARMNAEPGTFTPGFINTMAKYIAVKGLPLAIDVEACRRNWGSR